MKHNLLSCLVLLLAFNSSTATTAGNWPHWLGPNRDNIAPDNGSFDSDLSKWKIAWKTNVGLGYSSVAVAGGRAFTIGNDEKGHETVFCFDAATGQERWKHTYQAELLPKMHPGGPNATPSIIGDRVITLSKDGQVFCLTAKTGAKIWEANLAKDAGLKLPQWGFASSPVLDADRLIFCAGKVVALDPATGKLLWISKNDYEAGYATAVVFERAGKKYIAAFDAKGLSILTGDGADEVARHPFKAMFNVMATTPAIFADGSRIFISSNAGAAMLAFDGKSLTEMWANTEIKNTMNNSVIFGDALYGIDGRQGSSQCRLVSVNLADGHVNWAKTDFGYGNTIGVGKRLLAFTEVGELVTLDPSPKSYSEISRRHLLGKLCWTTPVYADQRIYLRNDRGDVVCLEPM